VVMDRLDKMHGDLSILQSSVSCLYNIVHDTAIKPVAHTEVECDVNKPVESMSVNTALTHHTTAQSMNELDDYNWQPSHVGNWSERSGSISESCDEGHGQWETQSHGKRKRVLSRPYDNYATTEPDYSLPPPRQPAGKSAINKQLVQQLLDRRNKPTAAAGAAEPRQTQSVHTARRHEQGSSIESQAAENSTVRNHDRNGNKRNGNNGRDNSGGADGRPHRNYAAAAARPPTESVQQQRQRTRKPAPVPMLVGTKRMNQDASTRPGYIAAAKPYISRAVYCVDNVSTDATAEDIALFVSKMGVTVLSCISCDPRRTRWQRKQGITPTNRNAFRICIPREESEKFLCANRWPAHIGIAPWIFTKRKPGQPDKAPTDRPQSDAQSVQQRRVTIQSPSAATGGATAAVSAAAASTAAAPDRSKSAVVVPTRSNLLSTSTPAVADGAETDDHDVAMSDAEHTITENNNGGD